jgi:hypothetical protein
MAVPSTCSQNCPITWPVRIDKRLIGIERKRSITPSVIEQALGDPGDGAQTAPGQQCGVAHELERAGAARGCGGDGTHTAASSYRGSSVRGACPVSASGAVLDLEIEALDGHERAKSLRQTFGLYSYICHGP